MRLGPTLFTAYLCLGAASPVDDDSAVVHLTEDDDLLHNGVRRTKRRKTRKGRLGEMGRRKILTPWSSERLAFLTYSESESSAVDTDSLQDDHLESPHTVSPLVCRRAANINTLPLEIIHLILKWVAILSSESSDISVARALAPITRTCRALHTLGRPLLYAHIEISLTSRERAPRSVKLLRVLARDATVAGAVLSLDTCLWNADSSVESSDDLDQHRPPWVTKSALLLLAHAMQRMTRLKALTCDRKLPFWVWSTAPKGIQSLEIDLEDGWTSELSAWLADRPSIRHFRFTTPAGPEGTPPLTLSRGVLPKLNTLTAVLGTGLSNLVRGRPVEHATLICVGSTGEVQDAAAEVAQAFAENEADSRNAAGSATRGSPGPLARLDLLGDRRKVGVAVGEFSRAVRSIERVVLSWEAPPRSSSESDLDAVTGEEQSPTELKSATHALCQFPHLEEVVFWVDGSSATDIEEARKTTLQVVLEAEKSLLGCPRLRRVGIRGMSELVREEPGSGQRFRLIAV